MIKTALVSVALLALSCCATPEPKAVARPPASHQAQPAPPCVQNCTDRRRIEAVGWDTIVAECSAECHKAHAP